MKYLVFDAGPIISITMNGLLPVLQKLKKEFNGKFILTPQVKKEVIDKPFRIKKFKLESMLVKQLLEDGTFTQSNEIISNQKLQSEVNKLMKRTNSSFVSTKTKDRLNIVHEGEASCIAFCNLCDCESMIVIDERTTRIIAEAPERLKKLLEKKLSSKIEQVMPDVLGSKPPSLIRSAELIYLANKKGLLQDNSKDFLDAALYGLKFKGTAISSEEIEQIKKMVRVKR
jgi:hypothetical protein